MKKYMIFKKQVIGIAAMSLTLFTAGCAEQIEDNVSGADVSEVLELPNLTAGFADAGTKTYVEEAKFLRWHEKDQISAFVGSTLNSRYEFAGNTGDNSGLFALVETLGENGATLDRIYAVYPFGETNALASSGEFSVVLPEIQNYAESSFGADANTMVAVTESMEDTFLSFKNTCGFLRLRFYNPEGDVLKNVTVYGNNGEKIAGASVIKMESGVPEVTMSEEATTEMTVDCGDGVAIGKTTESATDIWFVIPPTTFSKGITITATGERGALFTKSTSKEIVITRNEIQPMAALEVIFDPMMPARNEIWYTAAEKVDPVVTSFYENVVSNEFDEETGRGVITFDATLSKIGSAAFSGKTSLTSIILPLEVREIDNKAFYGCTGMQKLTLPSDLTTVGTEVFTNCAGELIVMCNIPSQSMTSGWFKGSKFTKVTIAEGVESVGSNAFYNCTSITEVSVSAVQSIGQDVFRGCTGLQKVVLEDGLETIGQRMFYGSSSLTEVEFPNSLKTIESSAFSNCTNLSAINLPEGLEKIGTMAFSSCQALTEVRIPSTVTFIGDVFSYCKGITKFTGKYATEDGLALIKDGYLVNYACGNAITSYVVPEGVTDISGAFYYAANLKSVDFPSTLETLQDDFSGCANLGEFKLRCTEPPFVGMSPWSPLKATDKQIIVPAASVDKYKNDQYWTIYSAIITGYYDDISDVTVSSKKITYRASEKVDLYLLGGFGANMVYNDFDEATGQGEICFDGDITSIPYKAFLGCSALEEITVPEGVKMLDYDAFYGCSSLKKVYLPSSLTSVGNYAFHNCTSLESIVISDGVEEICTGAFSGCTSLKTITIPGTVKTIGRTALYVTGLESVYCYAVTPPKIDGYSFRTDASNLLIYVPMASVDAYTAAANWSQFADRIVGMLADDIPLGYTVNLNSSLTGTDDKYGWRKSTTVANPSSAEFSGVYESNNYKKDETEAVMHIDINGLTSFEFYIRSDGESLCDYMLVSQLDQTVDINTAYNSAKVKASTRGVPESGTTIDDYTKVLFENIDGKPHRITIIYKKDVSDKSGTDRGYVLIPRGQGGYNIEDAEDVALGSYTLTLGPLTYDWRKSTSV